MPNRNLLHFNRLEAFKVWLEAEGHAYRSGCGEFEALQVNFPPGRWSKLYRRLRGEHFTVESPLMPLVTDFIFHCRGDRPHDPRLAQEHAACLMLTPNTKPPWEE